ncbi:PASTA domain containing protein [Emticicia oligotrophica DSM 17448]|uniref:PASTA domain containing protein n=1 Tax=Emticicia oligotrophica (strain DSM 17448 / CIP 109782 / MTCC 6937 / GPTSA100-15) TaxID=929562 RepID=A0ABN4AQ84_EMTOG|nr:PASTA domain-containing protein [Emticicia oligotrophica]AFK04344.1 PASTA domain containing protein [Emticicia oligotrophica DSM 17448]
MAKFSTSSKSDIVVHIGIIVALFLVFFFSFFFIYLPWSTNHGQSITVPDLKGMSIEEMEKALDDRDLDYEVSDCTFVAGAKPLSILTQFPKPGSSVKEGRKIYLTIVSETAPMVKLPDVFGRSESSAKNQLLSAGLVAGTTEVIPALEENTVLKVKFNGKEVKAGTMIPKGSTVVFVVGDGLGDQMVEIPNLVGMLADEAEILLSGQNLGIAKRYVGPVDGYPDGTIIKQRPSAEGNKIHIGDVIDVEIAGNAPTENVEDNN